MSSLERIVRASSSGHAARPSPAELDRADLQVAEARGRVERLAKLVEEDTQRGNATTHSRALLESRRRILREMIAHRDAVYVEFMKGRLQTESDPAEAPEA